MAFSRFSCANSSATSPKYVCLHVGQHRLRWDTQFASLFVFVRPSTVKRWRDCRKCIASSGSGNAHGPTQQNDRCCDDDKSKNCTTSQEDVPLGVPQ
eukprot:1194500-Prorocentrum_minimum.AAC.1